MNFLADESCTAPVIRALREVGHDVVPIAEVAPGATDAVRARRSPLGTSVRCSAIAAVSSTKPNHFRYPAASVPRETRIRRSTFTPPQDAPSAASCGLFLVRRLQSIDASALQPAGSSTSVGFARRQFLVGRDYRRDRNRHPGDETDQLTDWRNRLLPYGKHQSIKIACSDGAFIGFGGNYQNVSVAWQYSWFGKPR